MLVRFFAGAAEAAGCSSQEIDADGRDVAAVTAALTEGNERLAQVLAVSALLADGVRVTDATQDLSGASHLDVLPPFAGG